MKLIVIILVFISSFTYSQIYELRGADTAILNRIQNYRKSLHIKPASVDSIIHSTQIEKLKWMSSRKMVTHGGPLNVMSKFKEKLTKKYASVDSSYFSGSGYECIHVGFIRIPLRDTAQAASIIQTKFLKQVADSAVYGWIHSPEHNDIILTQEFADEDPLLKDFPSNIRMYASATFNLQHFYDLKCKYLDSERVYYFTVLFNNIRGNAKKIKNKVQTK
jgi:hypothetical protein